MPEEKNRGADRLPSKEEWIAASAYSPDDFDEGGEAEAHAAAEERKQPPKRKPD